MFFGAFQPQTSSEIKKVTSSDRSAPGDLLRFLPWQHSWSLIEEFFLLKRHKSEKNSRSKKFRLQFTLD